MSFHDPHDIPGAQARGGKWVFMAPPKPKLRKMDLGNKPYAKIR